MAWGRGAWPCRGIIYLSMSIALGLVLYLSFSSNKTLLLTHLNQVDIALDYRISQWDFKDTQEELLCRNLDSSRAHPKTLSKEPIPDLFHFVLLSEEGQQYELTYPRFLSVKAAILRTNATEIKIHVYHQSLNISNPYWQQIKNHVTLTSHERATTGPHGLSMQDLQIEHRSDILRLEILLREGGIYLDTDVFALKPFTDLLNSPLDAVLGHEGGNRFGLCNAVIVARPHSTFLMKWQKTYRTFDPKGWNQHSVLKPKQLQAQYPDLICPLSPSVFFWPTWSTEHVRYMFETISPEDKAALQDNMTAYGGAMYENQLAFHACGFGLRKYLGDITPEGMEADSRFNVLVRDIVHARL